METCTFSFSMKKKKRKPSARRPLSSTNGLDRSFAPEDKPLICFDRKTLGLLITLLSLLSLLTIFQVNGSSVGCWARFLGRPSEEGTLFGTAKGIRSDEWAIHTPAILSQANSSKPFSAANYSLGAHKTPLVMDLPVAHFTTIFRPQFWLFFVSNVETAFSFYWNMKFVYVIGGVFLLLMALLGNNFYVALFGALWVFFSGYTQWWYSLMWPEVIGCFALFTAAFICMLLSRNKAAIVVSSFIWILCSINFVLFLYPPHQVPFVYLSCALVSGVLIRERKMFLIALRDRFRWICVIASVCVVAGSLVLFYLDAAETLSTLSTTVYPGQRRSAGGGLSLLLMYGGFIGPFMSENHFPRQWENICEFSNFFLFFPIPMAFFFYRLIKKEKTSPLEMFLAVFLVILLLWGFVGFPTWLAKWTLFDRVTEKRTLLPLGFISLVWTCLFIDRGMKTGFPRNFKFRIIVSLVAFLAIGLYVLQFNRATGQFLSNYQMILACAFVTSSVYFLVGPKPLIFAILVLAANVFSYALVNPVSLGLAPILKNPVYESTRKIAKRHPEDKWIVYAAQPWPNLYYAAGAKVFNGLKWVPNLKELNSLSADPNDVMIYNRYGYINLYPRYGNRIMFAPGDSADQYIVQGHPQNEHWRNLKIIFCATHFPFSDELIQASFEETWPAGPFYIHKYRTQLSSPLQ